MSKVKNFKADVLHEIKMLKKHATVKEKSRLDFERFDYRLIDNCIYGQLTTDCESARAKKLMDKCCIRVMNLHSSNSTVLNKIIDKRISNKNFVINGINEGQGWDENGVRNYAHISALEAYICTKDAKNSEIINYIKGDSDILIL